MAHAQLTETGWSVNGFDFGDDELSAVADEILGSHELSEIIPMLGQKFPDLMSKANNLARQEGGEMYLSTITDSIGDDLDLAQEVFDAIEECLG